MLFACGHQEEPYSHSFPDLPVMGCFSVLQTNLSWQQLQPDSLLFIKLSLSNYTVIGAGSVCLQVIVKWKTDLLWYGTAILSTLMSVYGEQICSYLCLKVKPEEKQDNNSVQ